MKSGLDNYVTDSSGVISIEYNTNLLRPIE